MTANTVNGSENGARSGAQTLVLLAAPLNVLILRALASGPKQLAELRRETDMPAQSTLRTQLKILAELSAIEKHRRDSFPGALQYELTASGRELLKVARALEDWLENSPGGPLLLGSNPAKAAIKALAEGWSTTMLRALATQPLSLTELSRIISSLSYPSLERRLAALRLAGMVEPRPSGDRGTPYAVTDWIRYGIAPLAAAIQWERRQQPLSTAPVTAIDVETALLLSVPLMDLPADLSGSCRLAAEIKNGHRYAGAVIDVNNGNVARCTTNLRGDPDAWALGSISAWLAAVVEHDLTGLELGGDCGLARAVIDGLHQRLFKHPSRAS